MRSQPPEQAKPPSARSSLDKPAEQTLRARNSICLNCEYHLDGLEIVNGAAVCPECGAVNVYTLAAPVKTRLRSRILFTSLGVFGLAMGVPLLFYVPSTTNLVLLMVSVVALTWIVARLLRRAMDL